MSDDLGMMEPILTQNTNMIYRGDGSTVVDLPCQRARIIEGPFDGGIVIYSVWEPTAEQREALAAGANLRLGIYGIEPIPPCSLDVVAEHRAPEGSG
jgi:hypothetical protein